MSKINSWNELVYAVAKRAKELSEFNMPALRAQAGYGCDSYADAQRKSKGRSRGELVEEVLLEEWCVREERMFEES